MEWWSYDALLPRGPYDWSPATRGDSEWDVIDFHLDLGCGTVPKARLGIDRHLAPGVGLAIDLEKMAPAQLPPNQGFVHEKALDLYRKYRPGIAEAGLPFPDNSIESIVSHHCMEHIRDGFVPLMDEIYRILKPGGVFRAITPLFPSRAAVEDPDHKRYFMIETWDTFCGAENGEHFHESFSVPYTKCRFELVDKIYTPALEDPAEWWGPDDVREIRVALRKYGNEAQIVRSGEVHTGQEDHPRVELDEVDRPAEIGGDRELAGIAS